MPACPNVGCDHEFVLEYTQGLCPCCQKIVLACDNGHFNREYTRFCRICGTKIDYRKLINLFYEKKIQDNSVLALKEVCRKKLSFLESKGSGGSAYLTITGNRLFLISEKGHIYDWNFIKDEEIYHVQIARESLSFRSTPIQIYDQIFFGFGYRIFQYDLLVGGKEKEIKLKNESLSLISLATWDGVLYGLFIEKQKDKHIFGKINLESGDIENSVAIKDQHFSQNISSNSDSIFLFSKNAVYQYQNHEQAGRVRQVYAVKEGKGGKLNICGKTYYDAEMDLLNIPEEGAIMQLDLEKNKYVTFLRDLEEAYFVEYTPNRIAVASADTLALYDCRGNKLNDLYNGTTIRNVSFFNGRFHSLKVLADKILFSIAFRSEGGFYLIPWLLNEARVFSKPTAILRLNDDPTSNVDASQNFIGMITAAKEAVIWQF